MGLGLRDYTQGLTMDMMGENQTDLNSASPDLAVDSSSLSWLFQGGGKRLPYYLTIAAILVIAWLFRPRSNQSLKIDELPFYEAAMRKWIFGAEDLIKDSYAKFRDSVYQIKTTEGYQVMVPVKLVGELKGLPDDVLSQPEAIAEVSIDRTLVSHVEDRLTFYRLCRPSTQSSAQDTTVTCSLCSSGRV